MRPLSSTITDNAEKILKEHYGADEATVTVDRELQTNSSWTLKATITGIDTLSEDMCVIQADSGTTALLPTGTEDQYHILIYVQHKDDRFMDENGVYITTPYRNDNPSN